MLSSGVYGLFRLDGGPIAPRDVRSLGWTTDDPPGSAGSAFVAGTDAHARDAVHRVETPDALTLLVGHLEEPEALTARLGLAPTTPHARIARAALDRFGHEIAAEMIGEWSLLHWDTRARILKLVVSAGRRDRVLFAVAGTRVAVAPNLFALARLDWIDTAPDPAGLCFALGRSDLRARIGNRTMLAGVRHLAPATCLTITADGIREDTATIFTPQPRWTGSFDDAVAATDDLLRRIVRARVAQTAVPAAMLSGGLDSSILAWTAARERGGDQRLVLLTSVAPPGSGLPDETVFADSVAARLGLTTEHLSPPPDANIYRPTDAILGGASGPPLSNRHVLTDTFQRRGKAAGATLLIDGSYGEMTVTGRLPLQTTRRRLRNVASRWRRHLFARPGDEPAPTPFHVRLSPARMAALPDVVRDALALPPPPPSLAVRRPGDAWGYMPGADKALAHANEFYPGALREDQPYRDLRLLRLFAGFPADFLQHDGLDRAPARHLLAGHLPDAIRLRRRGCAASPDHMVRLQRQAPLARARIADFRAADVADWLDLDWLDTALARVAEHGPASVTDANEVQLTAITAEFLTWRTRT